VITPAGLILNLINLQRLISFLMKSYRATLDYLYNRLPMFQRTGPAAYKNSLDNTRQLDDLYNHPHLCFPTIHVAGTNGKGSVSHMLASILMSAGYKTGLYTSPHLKDFRERIRINGTMIPKREVISWVNSFLKLNRKAQIDPSFFELTVAMAFDFFVRSEIDIGVVEVGLGGRLDSTNIITPEVCVITNISFDHQSLLGDTLQKIAGEKAGIIKPGVPVVISQWQEEVADVFIQKAKEQQALILFAGKEFTSEKGITGTDGKQVFNFREKDELKYPELRTDLLGSYQRLNIPAALKTVELLNSGGWNIPDSAIYEGLANVTRQTGLQGRWQIIGRHPLVVCDTGHNEDGIRQVAEQIQQTSYRKLYIIFGVVSDKDPDKTLALLPRNACYYFTKAQIPRAMDENMLRDKALFYGLNGTAFPSVAEAFRVAKYNAGGNDLILITGSNFVVAEIL
jgi:dihydrofolate synthase / folylpolyglutamate synthase